ncbi:MAG: exodeoxyribonuclease VII large subunit [Pseudomonadota bacterium]|nr:exodeoxyribonuclease VII large subunit [Pseudomonadota bacterium]MDP1903362.1 exodeoxyribonuclease VII large subunit [Pseudomonadota bacterium]MDP2352332.1 exodeoxyribonuclease VII large subunit [Pseudomonadota bacterium]
MSSPPILSVSELNRLARLALEKALPSCWVAGEISNLTRASSGHWYFTLKDAQAGVRCAMFRNRNQFVDWQPREGDRVEVRAQPTLYEARGDYQLIVEAVRRAGAGALFEAFLKLKAKLEQEGLFAPECKRALPPYPRVIGIITSPQAAALRDVLTTLKRRWPAAAVVLYPTPVQGVEAPAGLRAALAHAAQRMECDVLLLVRGGGSLEDLWAFNDEGLARAIASSPIPVVSGVGHETDFTIADFVADLRAPTPTGAAQLATPDREDLAQHLDHLNRRQIHARRRHLDALGQRLDSLARRLRHPARQLAEQRRHLGHLADRLRLARLARVERARQRLVRQSERFQAAKPKPMALREQTARLQTALSRAWANHPDRNRLAALAAHLGHLNPQAVLERGYSITRDAQGKVIRDGAPLREGDMLELSFARGGASVRVAGKA